MIATLLVCALIGLAASTVYVGLAIVAAYRFRRKRSRQRAASDALLPPVTVLKPVHGNEPRLSASLESFFQQRYKRFEIVFGARSADDPALAVVEHLRRRYPQVPARIIVAGPPRYANAKVSTLAAMIEAAAYEHLVIADSDTRVAPECLREVTSPLTDPSVGLVTCLYRGVPIGGISSRLEALGMSVEMASGVLVADMLEGMRFALGPTIGTRKDVLERIGGVAALGDYCADDYVLGRLVWQAGRQVVLSPHVVDHVIVNRRWRASLQHQLRWMRSTRFSRPLGHVGTGLTFATPFGIAAATTSLLAHRIGLAIAVGVWAYATRVVQSIVVGYSTLGDRRSLSDAWLYPLRDLIGFVLWCLSFVSTAIVWRGERYKLSRDGRMQPANIAARLERRPTVVRPGVARGVSPVARGFSRADSTTRAEALSRAENKR